MKKLLLILGLFIYSSSSAQQNQDDTELVFNSSLELLREKRVCTKKIADTFETSMDNFNTDNGDFKIRTTPLNESLRQISSLLDTYIRLSSTKVSSKNGTTITMSTNGGLTETMTLDEAIQWQKLIKHLLSQANDESTYYKSLQEMATYWNTAIVK